MKQINEIKLDENFIINSVNTEIENNNTIKIVVDYNIKDIVIPGNILKVYLSDCECFKRDYLIVIIPNGVNSNNIKIYKDDKFNIANFDLNGNFSTSCGNCHFLKYEEASKEERNLLTKELIDRGFVYNEKNNRLVYPILHPGDFVKTNNEIIGILDRNLNINIGLNISNNDFFHKENLCPNSPIYKATKLERITLLSKINELGYIYDPISLSLL